MSSPGHLEQRWFYGQPGSAVKGLRSDFKWVILNLTALYINGTVDTENKRCKEDISIQPQIKVLINDPRSKKNCSA